MSDNRFCSNCNAELHEGELGHYMAPSMGEGGIWACEAFQKVVGEGVTPPKLMGEIRNLPEDFWQWSLEMQRGWLWKRCVALQQLSDLAGDASMSLIRERETARKAGYEDGYKDGLNEPSHG